MILINLLPKKVSKKKAGVIRFVAAAGVLVLAAVIAVAYLFVSLGGRISALEGQIAVAAAEKAKLESVNQEKANYENSIAELKNKLDIITEIQKGRHVPVRLLDELTMILDSATPVWLNSYSFNTTGISMNGYSLSNPGLAHFVTRLEASPLYEGAELLFSEKINMEGKEIYRFGLNARLEEPAEGDE